MRVHHGSRFSWTDLPPELLESIAGHLKSNPDDLHSFRCVCKLWRTSVSPPPLTLSPFLPHNLPSISSPVSPFEEPFLKPSLVVSTAVYLLKPPPHHPSATPWLVAFEQLSPGKLRLVHPLTRIPIKDNNNNSGFTFPTFIHNLSACMEVSKGFNLISPVDGTPMLERDPNKFCANKVLLWPNPYYKEKRASSGCENFEESSLLVLHNGGLVYLCPKRNSDGYEYRPITLGRGHTFQDIIIWEGVVVAIDSFGRFHGMEYKMKKLNSMNVPPLNMPGGYNPRWKRLLLDSKTNVLYLVVWDYAIKKHGFLVYTLDMNTRSWGKLKSLGNKVLFVSFDTCFFLQNKDVVRFQRNRVVFSKELFPLSDGLNTLDDSLFGAAKDGECFEFSVYKYRRPDNFTLNSAWPELTDALWPPPQWIWEDTSTSQEKSVDQGGQTSFELDKAKFQVCEMRTESCVSMNKQGQSQGDDRGTMDAIGQGKFSLEFETHKQSTDIRPTNASSGLPSRAKGQTTATNYQGQAHEEDLAAEIQGETFNDTISRGSIIVLTQTFGSNASKAKFEEVNIRSDLVPTLEKIWAKHGNIIGRSAVRNGDTIARALESLAMAVQILQSNSGRSLEKCQADYITSVLFDLQFMCSTVDWLVPFVEKALAVHRSKPFLDSLMETDKSTTSAEEKKMKLLDEVAKVEDRVKELEEERSLVSERIPISGSIDLDQCLGEGLY